MLSIADRSGVSTAERRGTGDYSGGKRRSTAQASFASSGKVLSPPCQWMIKTHTRALVKSSKVRPAKMFWKLLVSSSFSHIDRNASNLSIALHPAQMFASQQRPRDLQLLQKEFQTMQENGNLLSVGRSMKL